MKKEIKDVVIDADHLLFYICPLPKVGTEPVMRGKSLKKTDPKKTLKRLKKAFMSKVDEYVKTAEIESIANDYTIGKTIIVISDKSNFRYDIFPEYKASRKGRESTDNFKLLRKWAQKKYAPKENIEADDKVAWLVRNGAIGITTDKDLFLGVVGIWFNAHHLHETWSYPTKDEAFRFNLLQCVMGDSTDGIKGIVGIAKVKATALLDKHGWSFKGVLASYAEHGMSKSDALLTYRLVSMTQWSPAKGLKIHKKLKGKK